MKFKVTQEEHHFSPIHIDITLETIKDAIGLYLLLDNNPMSAYYELSSKSRAKINERCAEYGFDIINDAPNSFGNVWYNLGDKLNLKVD